MLLAVANRPADNNTTYVTGGDVSRFQRRSVPRAAAPAAAPAGDSESANARPAVPPVPGRPGRPRRSRQ